MRDEFIGPSADKSSQTIPQHQHNRSYRFFYTSDQRLNHLQEMLCAWLRNGRFGDSQVLIILDDVDALRTSDLSDLSNLISSDQVEVIYTTRDPTIADPSSHMHASNFEVEPLQPGAADGLLRQFSNPTSPHGSSIGGIESTSKITASLGHLPAAIINASHFLSDNFGSANPFAMQAYLHRWESDDTRHEILQYRHRTTRYPYTMQESYEVSVCRLKRNTATGPKGLFLCSLTLLRLLCLTNVESFAQDQIEDLKTLLGNPVSSKIEQNEVRASLEAISKDIIPIFRCITELGNVSLLSLLDGRSVIVINRLTKACAIQCKQGPSNTQIDDMASLLVETEATYLKQVADEISTHWAPASRREAGRAPAALPSSTC